MADASKDALTPAQLKVLQDKLPKNSPYNKGKSPFKKAKKEVNPVNIA